MFFWSKCAIVQVERARKKQTYIGIHAYVCICARTKLSFWDMCNALDRQNVFRKSQLIGLVDYCVYVCKISVQRKCAPVTACYDDDVDDNDDAKFQKDNTIPKRNSLRMHIVCMCVCAKNMSHPDPVVWLLLLVRFNRPTDQQIQPIGKLHCKIKSYASLTHTYEYFS